MKLADAHLCFKMLLSLGIGLLTFGALAQSPKPIESAPKANTPIRQSTTPPSKTTHTVQVSEKSILLQKIAKTTGDLEARQRLAYIYYKEKDYNGVVKILEPFSDKLDKKGRYLLFFGYKGKEDILNEIRMLQFLIATNKEDIRALTFLGDAYLRQEKPLEAISQFKTAIELDPKYRDAYEGIIAAYEKLNNRYELRIVFQDLQKIFGKDARSLSQLCKLYAEDAYFAKAIEYCNEAILKDPKNAENHVHLALSLKDSGGEEQAHKILKESAQRFPSSEPTQFNFGTVLEQQNNHVAAYKHFKAASVADNKSSRAVASYANAAFRLQKYDEALVAYERACKLDRKYIKDFHAATTELRRSNLVLWYDKYSTRQQGCVE